ncbi:MAG: hypothetical protein EBU49_12465, partial [Proteobacteria bacterium]|nr:hypothetical protein [Pseudomonadota bacterium]
MRQALSKSLALACFAFAIMAVFRIMPTSSLTGSSPQGGYYDKLARAFASGRLDVGDAPTVITSLKNPYGSEHKKYTLRPDLALWDHSLYKGKLYLYFGAAPALLLYLPYRVIFGKALSDGAALIFLVSLSSMGCAAIILALRRKSFPSLPSWIFGLAGLGLATTSLWFVLFARARTYEIPVAACAAAMTWAVWATVRATNSGFRRRKNLGIASLLYGIAVASRPHFIVAIGAIFVTLLILFYKEIRRSNRKEIAEAISPANYLNQPLTVVEQVLTGTFADGLGNVVKAADRI